MGHARSGRPKTAVQALQLVSLPAKRSRLNPEGQTAVSDTDHKPKVIKH